MTGVSGVRKLFKKLNITYRNVGKIDIFMIAAAFIAIGIAACLGETNLPFWLLAWLAILLIALALCISFVCYICPHCGAWLGRDGRPNYCKNCGEKISWK
jgi:hypothetical protein